MELKELIKDTQVYFAFYRSGFFYYNVVVIKESLDLMATPSIVEKYQFPVPLDDIGNATLEASDKSMLFMRWIRKAKEEGTLIKL